MRARFTEHHDSQHNPYPGGRRPGSAGRAPPSTLQLGVAGRGQYVLADDERLPDAIADFIVVLAVTRQWSPRQVLDNLATQFVNPDHVLSIGNEEPSGEAAG